jgi:hypothetical protein
VIKLGWECAFVAEKNGGGRRRNERKLEREEGHSLGHKLNITDIFKSISNFACKNNTSSYLTAFFIFSIVIPSIYTERIFLSIFTDKYDEGIFR